MKTETIKVIAAIMISTTVLISAGCGDNKTATAPVDTPAVFVNEAPVGTAVPIPEARSTKPGDTVMVSGLVMGVKKPFVDGRAAFIIGDRATLTPCNARDEDHCPTPWDVCCDPMSAKIAGTATVQVLDEAGNVLKHSLKGVNGLKELSSVTVAGKVAPTSTEQAFIINATAIYIKP